jgi:hypothetical protein
VSRGIATTRPVGEPAATAAEVARPSKVQLTFLMVGW